MNNSTRFILVVAIALASLTARGAALSKEELKFFETKIRPVLHNNCYKCHSAAEKVKGGLTVDSKKGLLAGGSSGKPSIVPGKPEQSLLLTAVRYEDGDLEMPPNGKLPDDVIADFERWIKMGAPDPRTGKAVTGKDIWEKRKNHWAFLPVPKKPHVPNIRDSRGGRNPVDTLVLAALRKEGLKPSPIADRSTLIRRAYFDLTGLPPTPTQYEDHMTAKGDWYGDMIDQLLGSRHYGERWGRHWLDVARYSDTRGPINRNREPSNYPYAWTYRDYVIAAFNEDKPYDQFIMEQLAVDVEQVKVTANRNKLRPALGFLTLGQRFAGNIHDIIDDRIDVTSKAFLGLTVSCSRCHDHKFDPIPTKDYYSWYGIFANSKEWDFGKEPLLDPDMNLSSRAYAQYYELLKPEMDKYLANEKVMKLSGRERNKRGISRDEFRKIQNDYRRAMNNIATLNGTHQAAPVRVHALYDVKKPRDYNVFNLGDPRSRGEIAPRRFLEVLTKGKREKYSIGSGRYELARDIASKDNPLTARVMINRIWLHHFGETFVPTPDDFGNQSDNPHNQPLLDYLARYFMEDQGRDRKAWSIKKMHRLIMTSNTYKQVSLNNARNALRDPYNKFFWRQNVQRLEFEAIRDSILAIGGDLDRKSGGAPVGMNTYRRSVYNYVDRNGLEETMFAFDMANPDLPTGKRTTTTVPLQALFMMNNSLVIHQIKNLCDEHRFKMISNADERLDFLYERLYQRKPTSEERRVCHMFIKESPDDYETALDRAAEARRLQAEAVAQQKRLARAKGQQKVRMMRDLQKKRITDGAFKQKAGLLKWEKLAHSMVMANEFFYVH